MRHATKDDFGATKISLYVGVSSLTDDVDGFLGTAPLVEAAKRDISTWSKINQDILKVKMEYIGPILLQQKLGIQFVVKVWCANELVA